MCQPFRSHPEMPWRALLENPAGGDAVRGTLRLRVQARRRAARWRAFMRLQGDHQSAAHLTRALWLPRYTWMARSEAWENVERELASRC